MFFGSCKLNVITIINVNVLLFVCFSFFQSVVLYVRLHSFGCWIQNIVMLTNLVFLCSVPLFVKIKILAYKKSYFFRKIVVYFLHIAIGWTVVSLELIPHILTLLNKSTQRTGTKQSFLFFDPAILSVNDILFSLQNFLNQ